MVIFVSNIQLRRVPTNTNYSDIFECSVKECFILNMCSIFEKPLKVLKFGSIAHKFQINLLEVSLYYIYLNSHTVFGGLQLGRQEILEQML